MAKRLRGWRLEMESGITKQANASKALEKAEGCVAESILANKLLFLWARGQLSATLIRELADGLHLHKLVIGELNQGMFTGRS